MALNQYEDSEGMVKFLRSGKGLLWFEMRGKKL